MTRLDSFSRSLAERLFEWKPSLRDGATIEVGAQGLSTGRLLLQIYSPTLDPERALTLWVEEGWNPSIGFGKWHTHADLWVNTTEEKLLIEGTIQIIKAIMTDCLVLFRIRYDDDWDVLDLSEPDAIADELTAPGSTGYIEIRSWTGRKDETRNT